MERLDSGIIVPDAVAEEKRDAERREVAFMAGDWKKAHAALRMLKRYGVVAALLCETCKSGLATVEGKDYILRCRCTDRKVK